MIITLESLRALVKEYKPGGFRQTSKYLNLGGGVEKHVQEFMDFLNGIPEDRTQLQNNEVIELFKIIQKKKTYNGSESSELFTKLKTLIGGDTVLSIFTILKNNAFLDEKNVALVLENQRYNKTLFQLITLVIQEKGFQNVLPYIDIAVLDKRAGLVDKLKKINFSVETLQLITKAKDGKLLVEVIDILISNNLVASCLPVIAQLEPEHLNQFLVCTKTLSAINHLLINEENIVALCSDSSICSQITTMIGRVVYKSNSDTIAQSLLTLQKNSSPVARELYMTIFATYSSDDREANFIALNTSLLQQLQASINLYQIQQGIGIMLRKLGALEKTLINAFYLVFNNIECIPSLKADFDRLMSLQLKDLQIKLIFQKHLKNSFANDKETPTYCSLAIVVDGINTLMQIPSLVNDNNLELMVNNPLHADKLAAAMSIAFKLGIESPQLSAVFSKEPEHADSLALGLEKLKQMPLKLNHQRSVYAETSVVLMSYPKSAIFLADFFTLLSVQNYNWFMKNFELGFYVNKTPSSQTDVNLTAFIDNIQRIQQILALSKTYSLGLHVKKIYETEYLNSDTFWSILISLGEFNLLNESALQLFIEKPQIYSDLDNGLKRMKGMMSKSMLAELIQTLERQNESHELSEELIKISECSSTLFKQSSPDIRQRITPSNESLEGLTQ